MSKVIVNDEIYKEMDRLWGLWKEGKLEYRRNRSEWVEIGDLLGCKLQKQYLWRCSACGTVQTIKTRYCPACGALNDEVTDE